MGLRSPRYWVWGDIETVRKDAFDFPPNRVRIRGVYLAKSLIFVVVDIYHLLFCFLNTFTPKGNAEFILRNLNVDFPYNLKSGSLSSTLSSIGYR